MILLCYVQDSETALYWAAERGDANIVQILVDHGAAVDLGRNAVTNQDHLLPCGWNFGCGSIVIHAWANENYQPVSCEIWAWLLT